MSLGIPEQSAARALDFVSEGAVVGLGSGRAASAFVRALADRIKGGFRVRGVPTSEPTGELAQSLGIPLVDLNEVDGIDVTVDGADEVDPSLNLIKGLGGALVREKIVAAASKTLIICVGEEKLVQTLGDHGVLPIEVIPLAREFCRRRMADLAISSTTRLRDGRPFLTDNGNHILDASVRGIDDPAALEACLESIPGVVGTGLFLRMADKVLIEELGGVRVLEAGRA